MAFVKVVKNKAYYKRYQVKYRRRREGKTDYHARRKLVAQDKNKYNSPKYRFIVRRTNKDVICQVAYAKVSGDMIMAVAYAHELPRYGLQVGLTNYAACYCTGLLCARRLLDKLGLADKYAGVTDVKGTLAPVKALEDGPRPFRAFMDVGLARTTTGAKIFSVLKGASDGGMNIPHSEKRFVGYDTNTKKFKPDVMRSHIFGGHIASYMKTLQKEDPEQYKQQFARYINLGIQPEHLEALYKKVHAAIRKDPKHQSSAKPAPATRKSYKKQRLSLRQRRDRVRQKKASAAAAQS